MDRVGSMLPKSGGVLRPSRRDLGFEQYVCRRYCVTLEALRPKLQLTELALQHGPKEMPSHKEARLGTADEHESVRLICSD